MQKIKQLALPVFLGLIVLLGSLWIGRYKILILYYRQKFQSLPFEKKVLSHEKEILKDQEILSKVDLFKPSRGTKDAGPFLNSKVHWEIGEIHHQGSLVLPEFIKKEMNKDWAIKKPLFNKMGLQFGWMKDLLQYDHWAPDENSPAFPEGKKFLTYSFPVPSYRDLITWAKLRLLYGKEKKDIKNALIEVRHLIRLIWTNDYLVSSMVAINMLKLEHQFFEILLPEEETPWEFIPEDTIMRAKRYAYGSRSLTEVYLSEKTFKKFTATEAAICPMVVEGMMGYISMRDMMKTELEDQYALMDALVKKTQEKCRTTVVHKMWNDPTWPSFLSSDEQNPLAYLGDHKLFGKKITWKDLKESDELKVLLGYILLTSGQVNNLGAYGDK